MARSQELQQLNTLCSCTNTETLQIRCCQQYGHVLVDSLIPLHKRPTIKQVLSSCIDVARVDNHQTIAFVLNSCSLCGFIHSYETFLYDASHESSHSRIF